MVRTRSRRVLQDPSLALFGIRLRVEEQNVMNAPNTKEKKIKFLKQMGQIVVSSKAADVNAQIRQFLYAQIRMQPTKPHTIPMLFRQVFGKASSTHKYGTVIGYLPATRTHTIQWDGTNKTLSIDLTREKNWSRVPWPGNFVDRNDCEVSNSGYVDYGPDCPKCFAFLGIGEKAWARCQMCGLNEPGAMWSSRFSHLRDIVEYNEE